MNSGLAALQERVTVRRKLGAGAFGTVYEAVDAKFGGRVAVKLLTRDQPRAIYRFKQEFRSLADVVHPNLVRLYELNTAAEELYFTMELVDGVDLLSFVRRAPVRRVAPTLDLRNPSQAAEPVAQPTAAAKNADPEQLRELFLQLACAVQALHDAGKLHCDIKPSNTLVTPAGRVVVVDFGLVSNVGSEDGRAAIGTPGYASPEQTGGRTLGPASDWYSVGAMLYEALIGVLPPAGPEPIPNAGALGALAMELLEADPSSRPTGAEVVRRLGGGTSNAAQPPRPRLFGRSDQLRMLRDALAATKIGAPVVVRVSGASGIGKSALVTTFLDELGAEHLVLRGRCYEQESVPYKALDPIVDALAEHLRRQGSAAVGLLPPDAGLLARLFPVLRDVLRPAEGDEALDAQEQRRRGTGALRALMGSMAVDAPAVWFLDDVQWGDVDSANLLAEVIRAPGAPALLVIIGCRRDDGSPFLSSFDPKAPALDVRTIELGELPHDDAMALADHLLLARAGPNVAGIVREAAGHPLFLRELAVRANESEAHATETSLPEMVLARLNALDPPTRRLLEAIAVAGRPVEDTVAVQAAMVDAGASWDTTLAIRRTRLVSARAEGGLTLFEPAHDRVREIVVGALSQATAREHHLRIGDALLALTQPDPERLVHHFHMGGDAERTRRFAVVAADRAEASLAFDRAARYTGLLLSLTPNGEGRWQLLERHGRALADAGRAHEAAEAYDEAAQTLTRARDVVDHEDRAHLHRRLAGELTLRSGRLPSGTQRMERVLRDVGVTLPESRTSATWLAAGRRLKLFAGEVVPQSLATLTRGAARKDAAASAAARKRLDALWSAWSGLTQMNHVVGDALALQYLLEAKALGEPSYVLRGLGVESVYEAVIGGPFFRRRCDRLVSTMSSLIARSTDPYDRAFLSQCQGGIAWFRGDWQGAVAHCESAIQVYRAECRGVSWEIALNDAYRLPGLAYLGEIRRLGEVVPKAYAAARERGDLFAANTLQLGQQSLTWLAQDRPDDAIAGADEAIGPFPRDTFLGPHYHHLFAIVQAQLYRGNSHDAWATLSSGWPGIERAKFLLAQSLRVEIRDLRARAAVSLAGRGGKDAPELHRVALADAKKIEGDDVPAAAPTAAMIRAGVALNQRRREDAVRDLRTAVAGFDRAQMRLHLHAARDRLGQLLGGTEGAKLRSTAASWMEAQGIRRPSSVAQMLAPGLE